MNKTLLKQYIKTVIAEDDGGGGDYGGFGFGGAGMGGMGGMYMMGSSSGLYKTFVKPFLEVIQTTTGASKEVMRRVWTAAQVALETIITTFVPIITNSYEEIFLAEKRDIAALRDKYKDIYDSNKEMFSHSDMNVFAFAMDPTRYLTHVFFRKSPKAAAKAIEILTGDNSTVKSWLDKLSTAYSVYEPSNKRRSSNESIIRERDEISSPEEIFIQMMNDSDVRNALDNSRIANEMNSDAVGIIKRFYSSVMNDVREVDKIRDFTTLKMYVKASKNQKAISSLENFEKTVGENKDQLSKIVPEFVKQAKRTLKGIYGSGIAAQIKAAKEVGMPNDSEVVTLLTKAQNTIEALK